MSDAEFASTLSFNTPKSFHTGIVSIVIAVAVGATVVLSAFVLVNGASDTHHLVLIKIYTHTKLAHKWPCKNLYNNKRYMRCVCGYACVSY